MMDNHMTKIVNYYLLCSVINGKQKHIISDMSRAQSLFSAKELGIYFKKIPTGSDGAAGDAEHNTSYYVNESVVGGRDSDEDLSIISLLNE